MIFMMNLLIGQRQEFDIYTVYCLKKMSAERCIDELGGDQNAFLQVRTLSTLLSEVFMGQAIRGLCKVRPDCAGPGNSPSMTGQAQNEQAGHPRAVQGQAGLRWAWKFT